MKKKTRMLWVFAMFVVVPVMGCYEHTGPTHDSATDVLTDDGGTDQDVQPDPLPDPPPDSECLAMVEPVFERLEYQETVPAHSFFTLTIHHEPVMAPSASYSGEDAAVIITLSGMVCTCDPCPVRMPESSITQYTFAEGLPAGEYLIDIQGNFFPLHVIEECIRNSIYIESYSTTCPEELRINETALIDIHGAGSGCGCGGYMETTTSFEPPSHPNPGRASITAEEVICDPSQCCEFCACIDMYNEELSLRFPEEGFYYIWANDETICYTMVFGEDGCSDWIPMWVQVLDYTQEVVYGDPVVFTLSVSTGFCCSGVPSVTEERLADNRINLSSEIEVCEGNCCYMCDCMDMMEVQHTITGLDMGVWEVCVEGAGCYEVAVWGLD